MLRTLGHYRFLRELGRGGMGQVYLAEDTKLGRRVALKILAPALAANDELVERFEREAKATAALSHPGIVTLHSFEEADGVHFLTMEYVAGLSLGELIADGPLPVTRLVELARLLAVAVGAAHGAGIVHRDLKPQNVMVAPGDVIKVLDFGLARFTLAPGGSSGEEDTAASGLTHEGAILGTTGYMSPEQVRGEQLDARSDVFALGVILYELASGRKPFTGSSRGEVMATILRDAPEPLATLRPELPKRLLAIVERCLHKERVDRYADATELAAELASVASELSAPAAAAEHVAGNVPPELDEFVGRARELRELQEVLEQGARLVTILGPAGTGKTRLVQHHALLHGDDFPGGVWFADLSDTRSRDGILHAVASALEVQLGHGDPDSQLGHAIAARGRCLLVLDNFEQVVEHAPQTVGNWLGLAPDTQLVVTSRVRLNLPSERDHPLEPLEVEDEGVALFEVRARARRPGFEITAANRSDVIEVVRQLDGLPLAIELAAARSRVLTPSQLVARIRDRFRLLSGGSALRGRQATLRAAIDWSWDLLEPWEQAALAQCSVFEGGFMLESAEAVLDLTPWSDAPWPMDVVQALVDKSLLKTWMPPHADEQRFGMYASIQEYAADKLGSQRALPGAASGRDAHEAACARHGTHFAQLGTEQALRALRTHSGVALRRILAMELDNLVAACRRAVARSDGSAAVATYCALAAVLEFTGPCTVGLSLGRAVLELGSLSPRDEARARCWLGRLLTEVGRLEDAFAQLEHAAREAREAGDARIGCRARCLAAYVLFRQGRLDEARESIRAALELSTAAADRGGECEARLTLGVIERSAGNLTECLEQEKRALSLAREVGDRPREGTLLSNLSNLFTALGRLREGVQHADSGLVILREVGHRRNEGAILEELGKLYLSQGNLEVARSRTEAGLTIAREVGSRMTEGCCLRDLGEIFMLEGASDQALAHFDAALVAIREADSPDEEGWALAGLGSLHLEWGRAQEAKARLTEALAIGRELGFRDVEARSLNGLGALATYEHRHDEAHQLYEQAVAMGREMSFPYVIGGALAGLADVARSQGSYAEAVRLAELAKASAPELFYVAARSSFALVRGWLGTGELAEARAVFAAVRDADLVGPMLARVHCAQAAIRLAEGDGDRAAAAVADAAALAIAMGLSSETPLGREIGGLEAELAAG